MYWWQESVAYQIYPRSFRDADGDGVGDIAGIRSSLTHLAELGVDALWLSPIYDSPMADFGYDVRNHCAVDPIFGSLDEVDALISEAHGLDLRVLLDWVPNHTSDQHEWFRESSSSRSNEKAEWYIWRDGEPDQLPNNWKAAFGGPAWTWSEARGQWYFHFFLPQQPDLNWSNPGVRSAMHEVLRFWLDRGVDGFRADVVHLIGKDMSFPDAPPEYEDRDLVGVHDVGDTHTYLREIHQVLREYKPPRPMVGEIHLSPAHRLRPYYGSGDELDLVFNFALLNCGWSAPQWRSAIEDAEAAFQGDAWPTWALSNHDASRVRTRLGGSDGRARAAMTILLTLRGTPFLFQGEELGLQDAEISRQDRVDPGGRDGSRAPIPWDAGPRHGWQSDPWLPWPPNPADRSVAAQRSSADSMLSLTQGLLRARKSSQALVAGTLELLDLGEDVLAYTRISPGDRRVVVVNFAEDDRWPDFGQDFGEMAVQISSLAGTAPGSWDNRIFPGEALVLRPISHPS